MWNQVYDPFGNATLSTAAAALPVITLLVLIASNRVRAPIAIIALLVAIGVAVWAFTMPPNLALRAAILGAVTGFFPIGWIVLNVLFLYRLTLQKAHRRHARSRIRGNGYSLPLLWHAVGLARGGAHGLRYRVQRVVRQPAENNVRAAGPVAGPDIRRQFLRGRHGQNDRRPVDRGGLHGRPTGSGMRDRSCASCSGIRSCSPASLAVL